jgi:uncharacterized protein involved in oxidation of intracellular sulfur
MKLGIIIYSNDPETVWNTFRFALKAREEGESVTVFLTGRGVEADTGILDSGNFDVGDMKRRYLEADGKLLCCGTCSVTLRGKAPVEASKGGLKDMLDLIRDSDRVLTF